MKQITGLVDRSYGVITKERNLELLHIFKNFPVFFGCTNQPAEHDYATDMIWEIETATGLIQLSKLIPLEILYMEQHVDAVGKTWNEYYEASTDFIVKNKKGSILEIGGGSGKLAKNVLAKDISLAYTMMEPNPTFEETERLKVIREFFTKDTVVETKGIQTVVFSQVLEHAYDPEAFLDNIYGFLPVGGRLVFAYPYLENWFANKYTNAINFEHTFLLTDYFVDFLLKKIGFSITEKTVYKNHSHFYVAEKITSKNNNTVIELPNRYKHYKKMFSEFIQYHTTLVAELNQKINETDSNIYLFGAHIFSQFLFAFGLNEKKIKYILDNSPLKQEKRLYGSSLMVKAPVYLSTDPNPKVILKAGIYNEEIKKDILQNINPNTEFWE